MSIEALNWAWDQGEISSTEKFVFLALANYANEEHQSSLSFAALQGKTNLGRVAVREAINRLETKKLIVKLEPSSAVFRGRTGPLYQLVLTR